MLAESLPPDVENYQTADPKTFSFPAFFKTAKRRDSGGITVLLIGDPRSFFRKIRKSVEVVKAAGGIVRNEANHILFIFRKGTWDLPKGKLDPGEKTKKAAIREVEEECGIKVTECGKKLFRTWHAYDTYGRITLKKTTWYAMHAFHQPKLVPQLEEEITLAKWIPAGDVKMVQENTYPLIRDILPLL